MINKKYITRRILDTYSEEVFSKRIMKKRQEPFFPFRDKGVDVVGIDKKNNLFFYQLKARNINIQGKYSFMVNIKKLNKFPKTKRSFWVFCCFKEDNSFDFFVVPLSITKKWFRIHHNKANKKHEQYFFSIRPLAKNNYEMAPRRLNRYINIMKYLIK